MSYFISNMNIPKNTNIHKIMQRDNSDFRTVKVYYDVVTNLYLSQLKLVKK